MAETIVVNANTSVVISTAATSPVIVTGGGASAYQIWLDEGNVGTEQDFIDSLVGPAGPTYSAGTGIGITGTTITNTAPNVVQTLSIAGQDLTLSGGGGTVAIPSGASDALGTGFTSGGGSGTIPAGTTIAVQDGGDFILDLSAPMANGDISYIGDVGANIGINISGTTFTLQAGNAGMSVSTDDEKMVITGNGAVLPNLTTAQRNALTGVSAGQTIYNTDATATDSSTGVMQVYNGSTWKNAW